jgi:hypothetical protein
MSTNITAETAITPTETVTPEAQTGRRTPDGYWNSRT